MSFAIIISEKGGAERRELFDKNEVVVGRLQGNDLMLQKSNVSKRHAKLLFHNGRFIVADMESTNGTYVNGRRIGKPTIVREGDKIYVGDFVLRCEAGPGVVLAPESSPSAPGPREATAAELAQPPSSPPAPPPPREGISHYPLEHDPDDSQSGRIAIPAAPRLPSNLMRPGGGGGTQALPLQPTVAPIPAPPPPQGPVTDQGNANIQALAQAIAGAQAGPPRPTPRATTAIPAAPAASPSVTPLVRETTSSAQRLALLALLDAFAQRADMHALREGPWPVEPALVQRVEQQLREQIAQLRQAGELSGAVDPAALMRDASRELLGLGPLGILLEDPEITTLQIHHHGSIQAFRGASLPTIEAGFSGEEALLRALHRLCLQGAQPIAPNEALIERHLPSGHLLAVLPPLAASGATVVLRRPRPEPPLEDPVRVGVLSRVAWTFLQQCLGARLGVLVVGQPQTVGFFAAMLSLLPPEERTALLLSPELQLPLPPHGVAFRLNPAQPELLHQITRLGFDRLIATCEGSSLFLDALSRRLAAPLVFSHGTSARQAIARITARSCAAQPGLSLEAARELLGACFDVVVEVARLRDGRIRVLRIAEILPGEGQPLATRDLFLSVPDRNGSGERHLAPCGTNPSFLDDLRHRGFSVDSSLFERSASR
jgi:pilus assembly protein CpaF